MKLTDFDIEFKLENRTYNINVDAEFFFDDGGNMIDDEYSVNNCYILGTDDIWHETDFIPVFGEFITRTLAEEGLKYQWTLNDPIEEQNILNRSIK